MKLVPVTVNVKAALPTIVELGFNWPFVSDGSGLVEAAAELLPPPHPESHVETAGHTIVAAIANIEHTFRGRNQMLLDTPLADFLWVSMVPPGRIFF